MRDPFQLGNMGVFYKQRDNMYFPVPSFVLPVTLLRVPLSIVIAFLYTVIVYWSTNMDPSAGRHGPELNNQKIASICCIDNRGLHRV